jgi:CRP/FNR family transcriptional regulator, cyclic AMP receptor protein
MAADTKLDMLRSVSLFAALGNRDLEQVARLADEIDVPAGKVLMREGDRGAEMFVIVSGEAKVERGGQEIGRSGPGSVLGEIALLSEGPRTATVTVTAPSRLLVLAHREFHSLLADVPAVRTCVMDELARRLRAQEPGQA